MDKRVMVYLDTGATREHLLVVKDDDDYVKHINDLIATLTGDPRTILLFTTPSCIYKVQNIIALEFLDPPPQTEKLSIGFRPTRSEIHLKT